MNKQISFSKLVKLASKKRDKGKDKFHFSWIDTFRYTRSLGSLKRR